MDPFARIKKKADNRLVFFRVVFFFTWREDRFLIKNRTRNRIKFEWPKIWVSEAGSFSKMMPKGQF